MIVCLSKSQFKGGEEQPFNRVGASAIWTSQPGRIAASDARRAPRCITVSHVAQIARTLPDVEFLGTYSTSPNAGGRGSRHRKQ
ncbi:hypothetical protein BWQ93_09535 [Sphingopyxis sp. QXT-31]|nr:hypothetical protein BWQ93_09535 [Sphingopyxis sp. QXT-31]